MNLQFKCVDIEQHHKLCTMAGVCLTYSRVCGLLLHVVLSAIITGYPRQYTC